MPYQLPFGRALQSLGCATAVLLLAFSCTSKQPPATAGPPTVEELLKRKKPCVLSGGAPYPDTAYYTGGRNAAYAYGFSFPKNFQEKPIEIFDKNGVLLSDTTAMTSPDGHASLKIWIGETISFPLGAMNDSLKTSDFMRADSIVEHTIANIRERRYPYLSSASIDYLCHGYSSYEHSIALIAHNAGHTIIYKIQVSELPVSGDLIFKNMVFTYDKGFAKQYHAVGITLANDFGPAF